jgi:hypothetical protein
VPVGPNLTVVQSTAVGVKRVGCQDCHRDNSLASWVARAINDNLVWIAFGIVRFISGNSF